MTTRRSVIASGLALPLTSGGLGAALAADAPPARLGPIRAITTTVADLKAVRAAYRSFLGYQVVEEGRVTPQTAKGWAAPAVEGARFLSMAPQAGPPTLLRFVEQPQPPGFMPMTTFGWNSTEIIVQSSDAVAERLQNSPFRIVGPPRNLASSADIRAMQVVGPGNEMLYLTSVARPLPGRDMPTAEAFVGRAFIAVAGGRDIAAMAAFYRDTFGNVTSTPFNSPIRSLSAQNHLPEDTHYDLAVTALGGGTKLELDQYPASAQPRAGSPGGLPPGMAIVSFECADFAGFTDRMRAPPHSSQIGPFKSRRVGVMAGAAGELIELIELIET